MSLSFLLLWTDYLYNVSSNKVSSRFNTCINRLYISGPRRKESVGVVEGVEVVTGKQRVVCKGLCAWFLVTKVLHPHERKGRFVFPPAPRPRRPRNGFIFMYTLRDKIRFVEEMKSFGLCKVHRTLPEFLSTTHLSKICINL